MTNFDKGEGGGLKRADLIGTLDVQIRYNVSSLFATGCSTFLDFTYSCFGKGCQKKFTRQSQKVLWVVLSALLSKEIGKNGTRGHGHMFASAGGKQQK